MANINGRYSVTVNVIIYDLNSNPPKEVNSNMISFGCASFRTYKAAKVWCTKIVRVLLSLEDVAMKRNLLN